LATDNISSHLCSLIWSFERPVEIEIINSNKNGECEIIRLTQINGRTDYAGFFTTINTIWIKTPTRFLQIGAWLEELEK
jgi:hypothetical protein